jgi:hypothetical protein
MAGGAAEVVAIRSGWRPGLLGRIVALQAEYCARAHGFGVAFECTVAGGLSDFGPRLVRAPKAGRCPARPPVGGQARWQSHICL